MTTKSKLARPLWILVLNLLQNLLDNGLLNLRNVHLVEISSVNMSQEVVSWQFARLAFEKNFYHFQGDVVAEDDFSSSVKFKVFLLHEVLERLDKVRIL